MPKDDNQKYPDLVMKQTKAELGVARTKLDNLKFDLAIKQYEEE